VTAAGKSRSSQNALRHGLLARCLVLQEESPEKFQSLLDHHLERLQPADEIELGMVEEMVAAWWRMRRIWAIETHMLDTAASALEASGAGDTALGRITAAFKDLAASPALPLLNRYETRLHIVHRRALQSLLMLRATAPIGDEPVPISEAKS
jgi:hypothetical protein